MAIHLCASHGAVAELMALCHSHVRRLLPLRLTPRLRISSGFATSSHHTEQWAHWVMSRICQSGMLQLPWQSFYRRKQYHAAVVIAISLFILKYFHCVIESTLGICLSPLSATSTSNLFASCHQPSVPAVFTELSNRYDMFWLQIKFFSSHWRPRTEKLAVLSSSAAIGLWPCDSHRRANWSCSCIWAFYIFMSCSETKVQNSLNFNFKPHLY